MQAELISVDRDQKAAEVRKRFADARGIVDVDARQRLMQRVLCRQAFDLFFEVSCVRQRSPIPQIAISINLATLIIGAMSHLVTDDCPQMPRS